MPWLRGSELKTGKREVPGSISSRAYWHSRLEFSVVFHQNSRKYGLESFKKTRMEDIPHIVSGPSCDIGHSPTTNHPKSYGQNVL